LLVDAGSNDQIRAVSECIHNVIKGNVPITDTQLRTIRKYKGVLRALARSCVPIKKKRVLLKQKGVFLAKLLPLAFQVLLPTILNTFLPRTTQ